MISVAIYIILVIATTIQANTETDEECALHSTLGLNIACNAKEDQTCLEGRRRLAEGDIFEQRMRRLSSSGSGTCNGQLKSIYVSSTPGSPITNGGSTLDSITVPAITQGCGAVVDDVVLYLDISHTFIWDLEIALMQIDTNTFQNVWDHRCFFTSLFGPPNMLASFSDSFTNTFCIAVTNGGQISSIAGLDPYSIHDGTDLSSQTTWSLLVQDKFAPDEGMLNHWGLQITYCEEKCPDMCAKPPKCQCVSDCGGVCGGSYRACPDPVSGAANDDKFVMCDHGMHYTKQCPPEYYDHYGNVQSYLKWNDYDKTCDWTISHNQNCP